MKSLSAVFSLLAQPVVLPSLAIVSTTVFFTSQVISVTRKNAETNANSANSGANAKKEGFAGVPNAFTLTPTDSPSHVDVAVPTMLAIVHNVPQLADLATQTPSTAHKVWNIPYGQPTPDPAKLSDPATPPSKVKSSQTAPTGLEWNFPYGSPTPDPAKLLDPATPPSSVKSSQNAPTGLEWNIPYGAPTPDPAKLLDPATPPSLTKPGNSAPATLAWNIPYGAPTPDPAKLLDPATPPANVIRGVANPPGIPTSASSRNPSGLEVAPTRPNGLTDRVIVPTTPRPTSTPTAVIPTASTDAPTGSQASPTINPDLHSLPPLFFQIVKEVSSNSTGSASTGEFVNPPSPRPTRPQPPTLIPIASPAGPTRPPEPMVIVVTSKPNPPPILIVVTSPPVAPVAPKLIIITTPPFLFGPPPTPMKAVPLSPPSISPPQPALAPSPNGGSHGSGGGGSGSSNGSSSTSGGRGSNQGGNGSGSTGGSSNGSGGGSSSSGGGGGSSGGGGGSSGGSGSSGGGTTGGGGGTTRGGGGGSGGSGSGGGGGAGSSSGGGGSIPWWAQGYGNNSGGGVWSSNPTNNTNGTFVFDHNQQFLENYCDPRICALNDIAKYHSMSNEDECVYEIFYTNPIKCCLVIVEIGAGDGDRYSVSRFFEEALNWKTLAIEADPELYRHLVKNRPNASTELGAFCQSDSILFDQGSFHANSTEVTSEATTLPIPGSKSAVPIPCLQMTEVFSSRGIDHVDILVIRVQGDPLAFMRAMDWTVRVDIWIILFHGGSSADRDKIVRDVLNTNEYVQAEWDIKRWCQMAGHCLNNEVFLRKGFNPLPLAVQRQLVDLASRHRYHNL